MKEKKTKVYWIQNGHDDRNNLALHGMMQLSKQRQIDFYYLPESAVTDFFSIPEVTQHKHRHTSLLIIEQSGQQKRLVLDSEDSFAHLRTELLQNVDLYFTAAYHPGVFEGKTPPSPNAWQSVEDVCYYQERATQLIEEFGDQFYKIKRFVPIGPNSEPIRKTTRLKQKYYNLRHRLQKKLENTLYWEQKFQLFEQRHRELALLRKVNLKYDVVLSDTLWNGWPKHRYNLHQALHRLSQQYQIYASLKRHQGDTETMPELNLPLTTQPFSENYEEMLAASRLAVFATGYHWGWRNVMTLALYWGLPVLMDRPVYEPYFDFSTFRIFYNDDTHWGSIAKHLTEIDEALWAEIKGHNQQVYDQYLLPHKVATYIIQTTIAS